MEVTATSAGVAEMAPGRAGCRTVADAVDGAESSRSDGDASGATRACGGAARSSHAGGAPGTVAGPVGCSRVAGGGTALGPGSTAAGSAGAGADGALSQTTSRNTIAPSSRPAPMMPNVSSEVRERMPLSVQSTVPGVAGDL